jgi:hypothetical protein
MIYLELEDLEKAQWHAQESLRCAIEEKERRIEGVARFLLGKVLGRTDPSKSDEAEQSIMRGIELLAELKAKPYYYQGYLALGEFYIDTGQTDKALESLRKAEAEFEDMGMDYWLRRTREALASIQQ